MGHGPVCESGPALFTMRFLLLFLLPLALLGQTRSVINTGATANDGTGDSARAAFNKVNTNFATLWATTYTNSIGSAEKLKAWTLSGAYSLTSATRDADDVVTTATVSWPDGSGGAFTRTSKNPVFLTIDSYTITHTVSGKTVTQPTVARNANGSVTNQPALTIAP